MGDRLVLIVCVVLRTTLLAWKCSIGRGKSTIEWLDIELLILSSANKESANSKEVSIESGMFLNAAL